MPGRLDETEVRRTFAQRRGDRDYRHVEVVDVARLVRRQIATLEGATNVVVADIPDVRLPVAQVFDPGGIGVVADDREAELARAQRYREPDVALTDDRDPRRSVVDPPEQCEKEIGVQLDLRVLPDATAGSYRRPLGRVS